MGRLCECGRVRKAEKPDVTFVKLARLLTRRICLWETSGPRFINDNSGALKLGPDHDITQYQPPLSMASFGHSSDLSAPTSRYPNSSSTPLLLLTNGRILRCKLEICTIPDLKYGLSKSY